MKKMIPVYITSPIGITTEFDLFCPIFYAGTRLPCKSSKLLIGSANEEDVYLSIKIHQGNNYNSSYNSLLENLNLKKNINCHRGKPQLSVYLEVNRNSVMRTIISDILNKTTTESSIKVKSSSNHQLITPKLENIEHIDIAKKMSYAKRLVRTNKHITYSISTKNQLKKNIIDKIACVTQQIEHILNRQVGIEDLDRLLDTLSELSWKLNILSFTNKTA